MVLMAVKCQACGRMGVKPDVVSTVVNGIGEPVGLCANPVACRERAQKLGEWKVYTRNG